MRNQRALLVLATAMALSSVIAATPAAAQIAYDGPIIDRLNKWDSYPTHLFYGGKHHIWWCSRASFNGGCHSGLTGAVDSIWHVQKTGALGPGGWTGWQEVLTNKTGPPWACNHVCDPSVVRGTFSYNDIAYTHALFFTADLGPAGVNNAVGVVLSNDGLTWTPYPPAVITTQNPANNTYGAGAGGAAIEPSTGKILYAYDDTTMSPASRLKETFDALTLTPSPPPLTQLFNLNPGYGSLAPDIAFNPANQKWYAAVQIANHTVKVARTDTSNIFGAWTVIGTFAQAQTGNAMNNNPGLGKNQDTTLYIDTQGWAYVFFGSGTTSSSTWKVAQGRFRP